MHRTNRVLGIAVAGVLAVSLTACGGEDESPADPTTPVATTPDELETTVEPEETTEAAPETTEPEETTTDDAADTEDDGTADGGVPELADLWPEVMDLVDSAESLELSAGGVMNGADMSAQLRGQLDDSNYEVAVTNDGAAATVILADGVHYILGEEAFWSQSGAPDPGLLADTWIEVPEEMGLADNFSMSSLWSDFRSAVPTDPGDLRTSSAELGELDGEPAYHYEIDGEDAQVWVAAEGEPYLLKVELTGDSTPTGDAITLEISDWNDVEEISAPEDSTPIDDLLGSGATS